MAKTLVTDQKKNEDNVKRIQLMQIADNFYEFLAGRHGY